MSSDGMINDDEEQPVGHDGPEYDCCHGGIVLAMWQPLVVDTFLARVLATSRASSVWISVSPNALPLPRLAFKRSTSCARLTSILSDHTQATSFARAAGFGMRTISFMTAMQSLFHLLSPTVPQPGRMLFSVRNAFSAAGLLAIALKSLV